MGKMNRLTALAVSKATKAGLYGDGGGLYLQITKPGVKSWLFRFMIAGKARTVGLGPLHTVGLAEARAAALKCRERLLTGNLPIGVREQRQQELRKRAEHDAKLMTFEQCAAAYIAAHKDSWKNEKHIAQWGSTLATYAYPVFGSLPVASVDIGLIMKVLEPIWKEKTETATRLRGRIESVLDWATVRKYRNGENPARWKGNLDNLLPARSKVQKVSHHAALAYARMGKFMRMLRRQNGNAAKALELLVLTATRTSEVIEAEWSEFDLKNAVWTIPAERMKAGKEHKIPLSKQALAVLKHMRDLKEGQYVFAGGKAERPLSNMAMMELLRRMRLTKLTVHGFRSTFRDWTGEATNYPREVAEAALAHTIQNKVEAAYARGDLFEKRKRLMAEWAGYCDVVKRDGVVVPIRGAA